MITVTPLRLALCTLIASCALTSGCSSLSSGGSIREKELEIVPTESSVSFSRTVQGEITEIGLTAEQLGDPTGLEGNEKVATVSSAAERSLLVSEAWHLRGQNDLEVPIPESLERFLRSAHYAYEGIFGESGCQDPSSQLCRDLTTAYNRSVREVARLTDNGAHPPSAGEMRYIVDLQADNDPLSLSEWEIVFDDNATPIAHDTLGSAGTGCQNVVSESTTMRETARRCIPIAFLVTFDERVDDDRGRAHLVAFNTLEQADIQLHSRTVPLSSNDHGAWTDILTPRDHSLSCLGNAHPALPTVIFLTPQNQTSPEYEWPVIASAVAKDPAIKDHYNFCALNAQSFDAANPQSGVETISGSLKALLPNLKAPAQVIVVAQGPQGDAAAKALKSALKGAVPGPTPPIAVAGILSFPPPAPLASNAIAVPISSSTELSRSGTAALKDTKRLLSRLANEEDGLFEGLSRSVLSQPTNERLSPVM